MGSEMCIRDSANMMLRLHAFMGEKFDYIDIDPFGSPISFIDSAISAVKRGGVVALTATDTAPLMGVFPEVCARRYWSKPIRSGFAKELAVRIVLATLVLRSAALDMCIKPLLAYYADHYIRVYISLERSARKASKMLEKLSYVIYNKNSGEYRISEDPCPPVSSKDFVVGGPLYSGFLVDTGLANRMLNNLKTLKLGTKNVVERLLKLLIEGGTLPPLYYNIDELCSKKKINAPPINSIIAELRNKGYNACRVFWDRKGVKTTAPYEELLRVVSRLSS